MAETNTTQPAPEARRTFGQLAKQAGLFILFSSILIIPRIRRLRRRVWAWTCIRMIAAGCGAWLTWRYMHAGSSIPILVLGLILLLFGLLLRSSPVTKSVDDLARELNALVVLNGGVFSTAPETLPIQTAQIFVHPEQLIVVGSRERRLVEIPMSTIRNISVRPVAVESSNANAPWEVGIDWATGETRTAIFRYEGAFAEHLARVTESTVRSQWKKGLPVIPS